MLMFLIDSLLTHSTANEMEIATRGVDVHFLHLFHEENEILSAMNIRQKQFSNCNRNFMNPTHNMKN